MNKSQTPDQSSTDQPVHEEKGFLAVAGEALSILGEEIVEGKDKVVEATVETFTVVKKAIKNLTHKKTVPPKKKAPVTKKVAAKKTVKKVAKKVAKKAVKKAVAAPKKVVKKAVKKTVKKSAPVKKAAKKAVKKAVAAPKKAIKKAIKKTVKKSAPVKKAAKKKPGAKKR
jgi:hypothetical protein